MVRVWQYRPTRQHRSGGLRQVPRALAERLIKADMAQLADGKTRYRTIARVLTGDIVPPDPEPAPPPAKKKRSESKSAAGK